MVIGIMGELGRWGTNYLNTSGRECGKNRAAVEEGYTNHVYSELQSLEIYAIEELINNVRIRRSCIFT